LTRKRASNSGKIRLSTPNPPRGDAHNHVTPERGEKQAGKRRSAAVHGSDENAGDRGAAMAEQHPKGKQEARQEKDGSRRSAYELFKTLLLLVFQGENLYRFLSSDKGETACSKNSYYRFLEDCHANWNRFVMLLAVRVITYFSGLTRRERVKMLVLDDSVVSRERSKKTELLSHVYDHVRGKTVKGFNLLALGWTDAFSFVPVGFRMLASANPEKRLNEANKTVDKRTNGGQRRKEAVLHKPDAAISLIREALNAGITAQYVLMDTWFTNEPFIKRVTEEGLHVIGMLKDNKQKYRYNGKSLGLKDLAKYIHFDGFSGVFGSVPVKTEKQRIPVKLFSSGTGTSEMSISSFFPQTPICPTRKSCVCTAIAGRSNAASRSANPCSSWARNSTGSAMT
jgi:hypothetical protein